MAALSVLLEESQRDGGTRDFRLWGYTESKKATEKSLAAAKKEVIYKEEKSQSLDKED